MGMFLFLLLTIYLVSVGILLTHLPFGMLFQRSIIRSTIAWISIAGPIINTYIVVMSIIETVRRLKINNR